MRHHLAEQAWQQAVQRPSILRTSHLRHTTLRCTLMAGKGNAEDGHYSWAIATRSTLLLSIVENGWSWIDN